MEPKLKAQELVNKFLLYSDYGELKNMYFKIKNAKQCALIAVDEIIEHCNYVNKWYWQEVKQEIEKL